MGMRVELARDEPYVAYDKVRPSRRAMVEGLCEVMIRSERKLYKELLRNMMIK
jgi:hypothetical protein